MNAKRITLTFTVQETSMLLVALSNIISDYKKAGKRAVRRGMVGTAEACSQAAMRYTKLAHKIA